MNRLIFRQSVTWGFLLHYDGSRAGLLNIGLRPICDTAGSFRMLRVRNKTV